MSPDGGGRYEVQNYEFRPRAMARARSERQSNIDEEEMNLYVSESEYEVTRNLTTRKTPPEPTAQENERHEATHIPYREWCQHCLKGRGTKKQHRQSPDEKDKDVISFDYFFGSKKVGDETRPVLAMIDEKSQMKWARVLTAKGIPEDGSQEWAIRDAIKELQVWGYKANQMNPQFVFKIDGESNIRKIRDAIASKMGGENTPGRVHAG